MDKVSFGQILRETRERKGLELNATARRLRIRPDILKAIEEGNFAAMPPRGYTRNMVNGYARYLGLNPTEITGMYLDELYAYQVDYASSRRRSSGIEIPGSADSYSTRRIATRDTRSFSRENSATRGRTSRRVREDATVRTTAARTHQARGSALPSTEYTNFYSGPNVDGGIRSKVPYLIAAAIALLLVALIGWLLFGRGGGEADDSVANMPVTGVSSETGQGSSSVAQTPQAPTKFTFEYSVDNGATSWIEVYIDGETKVAEEVVGPATQSFDCSGQLQFICANPSGVTARQDGTELLLQPDSDGIVNMTIDFAEVLAKWRADNGIAATSANASGQAGGDAAQANDGTDAQDATYVQDGTYGQDDTYAQDATYAQNDGYADGDYTGEVNDAAYTEPAADAGYDYSYDAYAGDGTTGYYDDNGNYVEG